MWREKELYQGEYLRVERSTPLKRKSRGRFKSLDHESGETLRSCNQVNPNKKRIQLIPRVGKFEAAA